MVVIGVLIALPADQAGDRFAELDWINAAMVLNAKHLLDRHRELGGSYRTPPEILAGARKAVAELREGNRATYGPCADVDTCFRIDPRYR